MSMTQTSTWGRTNGQLNSPRVMQFILRYVF
jgi:hypothetical protein